ncbi:predicted protein [Uncinocarpus reesii 1704]|uniref:Uncharacterized protein n=1 Tax=Uncinocarpus reesii (strain UAMH 1704) TaxID=336963 RepID=C4JTR1_UNCRE|nr:uncharacterized protein UREG_05850 [Uncinocarpus reesii 1704]EEP81008.1 predicted protein [Uncinocarpus reesii 1704]
MSRVMSPPPVQKDLEAHKRRLRLLPRPIRTLSFSSKHTSSSPTTLSSPVHAGTRASTSRTPTTAITTVLPESQSPSGSPSKSLRRISTASRYFRPSALKRLFTPSTAAAAAASPTTSTTPANPHTSSPPDPPQRPPLTRLRDASSSIITYHRGRILDRDRRAERYCKIPLTQWNLENLQTELARQQTSVDPESSSNIHGRKSGDPEEEGAVVIEDDGAVRVLGLEKSDGGRGERKVTNESSGSGPSPSRRKAEKVVLPWLEDVAV